MGAQEEELYKEAQQEHLAHEADRIHAEEAAERGETSRQEALVEVLGLRP
jgi:hypothetical protein